MAVIELIIFLSSWLIASGEVNPETGLSMEKIVKKYGYPFEVFSNIPTEDGYLLDVYRIPHGKTNNNTISRPAVLLVHGLTGSARNFVVLGPKRGLAFLLAEKGYDVWLINCRGTPASRKHLTLDPKQTKYWEFSWHEIGVYDLPTTFELIHYVTKLERISYIGHSQGTTSFFVLGSEKPQYNKNVTIAIMFGPQAHIALDNPILQFVAALEPFGTLLIKLTGANQYPPPPANIPYAFFINLICTLEGFFQDICEAIFFIQGGYDPEQIKKGDFAKLTAGYPTVALQQALHYAQNVNTGEFRQYNFGREENLEKYGTTQPPLYNLSRITAPLALYYSRRDYLVDPKNVEALCREVPNCQYKYLIPHLDFSHYDFLIAKDIIRLVYGDVFKVLKKYNKNCKQTKAC